MARTSITAKLGLDTTAFQRGMARSQKSIGKFVKNGIRQFGALAGAAGLGSMAKSAIDLGSKISDLAIQLNIGTTELQVLDFAAREAGVGTEIMARALRNVQTRTEEAIKGNKSYGDAFKQLGIDVEEFKKLSVEKRMEAIAVAQSKATDAGAAYNSVARILGEKAGPALQEVLQNLAGPQGYGGLEAAAERAGEVMSKETIAKMDAAADRIESFKRRMTVLTAEMLTKVVPAISILGQGLGFVGDYVGVAASNVLSFGKALGTVISAVVAPAISQMEALGLAIKAAGQFAKRDFKGAKDSIVQAKDAAKSVVGDIKAIPTEIGNAFDALKNDMESGWDVLGDSVDKRAKAIEKNLNDIKGAATETNDEIKKTGDAAPAAMTKGQAPANRKTISTATAAPSTAEKKGIGSGFKSKFGRAPTFREREKAAGLYNTTLGRDGRKLDAMVDKGAPVKGEDPATVQKSMAENLDTIAKELTATTR